MNATMQKVKHAGEDDPLASVPMQQRIQVLYSDDDIVVFEKPCNLRSVPGNAKSPTDNENGAVAPPPSSTAATTTTTTTTTIFMGTRKKRPRSPEIKEQESPQKIIVPLGADRNNSSNTVRMTAAEAWKKAIETFVVRMDSKKQQQQQQQKRDEVDVCLAQLGATEGSISSVPRKFKVFRRYIQRSQRRIFAYCPVCLWTKQDGKSTCACTQEVDDKHVGGKSRHDVDMLTKQMFQRLQEKQRRLMNGPEPTRREESAFGQLEMLGYKSEADNPMPQLYPVHRLDCETSGVMVFARNEQAASFLGKAWRERDSVSKVYLARVYNWPLSLDKEEIESSTWGELDFPLAPVGEGIKWRVCAKEAVGAKSCSTLWRPHGRSSVPSSSQVTLELKPITGRTHQLRIHCAAVSAGIVGDCLYGKHPALEEHGKAAYLHLHAWTLSFPHPSKNDIVEFKCEPKWSRK